MDYKLKLEIKGLPKLPNSLLRQRWFAVKRERDFWHKLVRLHIGNQIPSKPLEKAKISYVRHSARRPDKDNLCSSFKFVQDALVVSGIIVDDSEDHIITDHTHLYEMPKNGRITIIVEEIKP